MVQFSAKSGGSVVRYFGLIPLQFEHLAQISLIGVRHLVGDKCYSRPKGTQSCHDKANGVGSSDSHCVGGGQGQFRVPQVTHVDHREASEG